MNANSTVRGIMKRSVICSPYTCTCSQLPTITIYENQTLTRETSFEVVQIKGDNVQSKYVIHVTCLPSRWIYLNKVYPGEALLFQKIIVSKISIR